MTSMKRGWRSIAAECAILIGASGLSHSACAASQKTLFYFGATTGDEPNGAFIFDQSGSFFDTAGGGSAFDCGVIYKFAPETNQYSTLYNFAGGRDGCEPAGAMVQDGAGILYGTTTYSTAFRFDSTTATETVLHVFNGGADGDQPKSGPIFGSDGKLYGTTAFGGKKGSGTIYRLDPKTGEEAVLVSFTGSNGEQPSSPLTLSPSGLLYGETPGGGAANHGVVFSLDPATGTYSTLYDFPGAAKVPVSNMALDSKNVLYGTTFGGPNGSGTVYSLDPVTGKFKILASFPGADWGGSTLAVDSKGVLYGTYFDPHTLAGVTFSLDPAKKVLKTLATFNGRSGFDPQGIVLQGTKPEIYGATLEGGNGYKGRGRGLGTLYMAKP